MEEERRKRKNKNSQRQGNGNNGRRDGGNNDFSAHQFGNGDDDKNQFGGNNLLDASRWQAVSDARDKSYAKYRQQNEREEPSKMAFQRMFDSKADQQSLAAGIRFQADLKNNTTSQDPYGGMVNAMWMSGGMDEVMPGKTKETGKPFRNSRKPADEVSEELATKAASRLKRKSPEEEPTMDLAQTAEEEKNGKDITEKDSFNPLKVARTFKFHERKLTALNARIRTSINDQGEISQSLMRQSLEYITSFYADCVALPASHPLKDARCKQITESFEGRNFDQDFVTDTLGGYAKQAGSGF